MRLSNGIATVFVKSIKKLYLLSWPTISPNSGTKGNRPARKRNRQGEGSRWSVEGRGGQCRAVLEVPSTKKVVC
jgi:hypothetical protein